MKSKLVLMCAIMFSTALFAESGSPLTLSGFLNTVTTSHPFFKKEKITSQLMAADVKKETGIKDWKLDLNTGYTQDHPLPITSFATEKSDVITGSLGIGKTFLSTGHNFRVAWSTTRIDQVYPDTSALGGFSLGPNRYYQNEISLNYGIPLGQNAGGILTRMALEQSQLLAKISHLQEREAAENFYLTMIHRFLDWQLLTEKKRIAADRFLLSTQQDDQMRKRRNSNLVTKIDVLRSDDALQHSKQNLLMIESQWKAKQAEIATLLFETDIYAQRPLYSLFDFPSLPKNEEALTNTIQKTRIMTAFAERQNEINLLIAAATSRKNPNLSLTLSGALKQGDTTPHAGIKNSQGSVYLNYQHTDSNTAAKATLEKAKLLEKRLALEISDAHSEIEAQLRQLTIQLTDFQPILALNKRQIEIAEEKTQEEQHLYGQGRTELTFVLQARDNEENARLNFAQNAAHYHRLWFTYLAITDQLLLIAEAG